MMKEEGGSAINQQIEDLRDRMRVLKNDRKANVELIESNLKANKEEIVRLRDENKDARKKLAHLSKTALNEEERDELKLIERRVEGLRKEHDTIRTVGVRHHKQLDALKDSVRDLELDSQRPHMEDNEYTRRIRALENKLDKAMIQFNEAQAIRKTYEQISRRLSEERVGFDNQLSAIERTLQAKERDHEELLLLSGDANHARDTALLELEKVRAVYEEERKKREKELRERHQMIALRRSMLERVAQREKLRNALASGAGQKARAEEAELRHSLQQKSIMLEKIESRNKVNIFENAFRKIKEATGVSDVNEVIQKIIGQESTTENLINVTRENGAKMENLTELKKRIKSHCEELKYSGMGGGQHRKLVDSYENQLADAATRLERSRLKYERLAKVVIAMKAGVGHLQDKMESFREEINGRSFTISDETVAEALHEADLCFETLLKRIHAGEEEMRRAHLMDSTTNKTKPATAMSGTSKGPMLGQSDMDLAATASEETIADLAAMRPFNQRIDLNALEEGGGSFLTSGMLDLGMGLGAGAATEDDDDNDPLDRRKVKLASKQIVESMTKHNKKKGVKKGNDRSGGGGMGATTTTGAAADHE